MKLLIDIPNYNLDKVQNGSIACSQILKAVKNGKPYEERPQDDDLCETCRYGDTCGQSDKGVSFAKHSKCWKYRYEGDRQ